MTRDAQEFGPIVDALVGHPFERTLALNSIKLRFGVGDDPRGTHYIWIDPPWIFRCPDGVVTTDAAYRAAEFSEWSQAFNPINAGVFESWSETADGVIVFRFANRHELVVPPRSDTRGDDDWYSHWYARDCKLGRERI